MLATPSPPLSITTEFTIFVRLVEDLNYAVVFSVKTIMALFFQTVIQVIVDRNNLDIHQFFIFFAAVCFSVFILSGLVSIGELIYRGYKRKATNENVNKRLVN